MTDKRVSISVVLFENTRSEIESFVKAFVGFENLVEIQFVDNSADSNETLFEELNLPYLHSLRNVGFGKGHNLALELLKIKQCEYHIFCNLDVIASENSVKHLIEFMDFNPGVLACIPAVQYPDGSIQEVAKKLPNPFVTAGRLFKFFRSREWFYDLTILSKAEVNQPILAPYISGCFFLCRWDVLNQVGYFDPRFFLYPEDLDLSRRIFEVGPVVYLPSAKVVHAHNRLSHRKFSVFLVHLWNMCLYYHKWGWFFDRSRKIMNELAGKEIHRWSED